LLAARKGATALDRQTIRPLLWLRRGTVDILELLGILIIGIALAKLAMAPPHARNERN
jgi:hypothetical protein